MSNVLASIEEALVSASAIANKQIHRAVHALDDEAASAVAAKAHALRLLEQQIDDAARETFGKRVREQLALHDALLAPWRRLPPELLSAIFLLAVPDGWEDMYASKRNRKLRLDRACYQWRRIARSTPLLWSNLLFDNYYSPLPKHITALKDALEKTAQAPLKVTIRLDWCPDVGRVVGWSDEAWALFCPESHRLTKLWLKDIPFAAFDKLMGRDFPLLEDLTIRCEDQWCRSAGLYDVPLRPFLLAPRVSRLRIYHVGPIRLLTLPRAWKLTRLSVNATNTSLTTILSVAVTCTATLVSLHVGGEHQFGAPLGALPTGWGSPRYFPRLEELYLGDDANRLSQHVLVPKLRILRLTADPYCEPKPEESLQNILDGSEGCSSLVGLSLKCYQFVSFSHLDVLLRRLQLLERLYLSDDEYIYDRVLSGVVSRELIHALARDDDNPSSLTFLPKLVYIELEYGDLGRSNQGSVERIYTSRQGDRVVDGTRLSPLRQLVAGAGMRRSWPDTGKRDEKGEEDEDEDGECG
ncbi:uncharacterized protein SCHCODRAFT_02615811 [Schizophyllum commune H4-8]|nr:uncharacterized protein SCHCODRAFT_02615811 [Schizophyllum commune H4-8]KAI5896781.1 hypothetical protein SCHCODRAFT_02615811 [Schizophyllum commune H4-8]